MRNWFLRVSVLVAVILFCGSVVFAEDVVAKFLKNNFVPAGVRVFKDNKFLGGGKITFTAKDRATTYTVGPKGGVGLLLHYSWWYHAEYSGPNGETFKTVQPFIIHPPDNGAMVRLFFNSKDNKCKFSWSKKGPSDICNVSLILRPKGGTLPADVKCKVTHVNTGEVVIQDILVGKDNMVNFNLANPEEKGETWSYEAEFYSDSVKKSGKTHFALGYQTTRKRVECFFDVPATAAPAATSADGGM